MHHTVRRKSKYRPAWSISPLTYHASTYNNQGSQLAGTCAAVKVEHIKVILGLLTYHGPTRGSGRVVSKKKLAGRVGSGREVFEISRVGSGRIGSGGFQISQVGPGQPDLTRPVDRGVIQRMKSPDGILSDRLLDRGHGPTYVQARVFHKNSSCTPGPQDGTSGGANSISKKNFQTRQL